MAEKIIQSKVRLKDSTLDDIAEIALNSLYPNHESKKSLSVKDVSGNSGAKTYICREGDVPKCIVKITDGDSIMNSHPNTISRMTVATKVMRENGIAPPILMIGPDFHVERSAGTSVMKDFFTFQSKLAPPETLAELLAKIH